MGGKNVEIPEEIVFYRRPVRDRKGGSELVVEAGYNILGGEIPPGVFLRIRGKVDEGKKKKFLKILKKKVFLEALLLISEGFLRKK